MKLFDVAGSPNCRKIRVLARELELPLEVIAVDFLQAKNPEYLSKNPTGKVPTLVDDDGLVLWESGAILLHLAEKRPGFVPQAPHARADMHRWMFFAATHIQPWTSLLGQERVLAPRVGKVPDAGIIALAERELSRFLPIVEDRLSDRDYLAGHFSLADIVVGCGLEGCEARGITLSPHLLAWRERLRARPSWSDP